MKKLLVFFTVVSSLLNLSAQEINSSSERKNDILLDPVLLIAVPMINMSYERIITENIGVGLNAMISLSDDTDDFKQISPYFRFYLGKKYAQGFFFEGFIPVTSQKSDFYDSVYDSPTDTHYSTFQNNKTITTVGLGFGIGGKWVIKNRLLIEASGGIARRFGSLDHYDIGAITGKFMGGIGYRF